MDWSITTQRGSMMEWMMREEDWPEMEGGEVRYKKTRFSQFGLIRSSPKVYPPGLIHLQNRCNKTPGSLNSSDCPSYLIIFLEIPSLQADEHSRNENQHLVKWIPLTFCSNFLYQSWTKCMTVCLIIRKNAYSCRG